MEKGGGGGWQGCALVEPERGGPWRLTFAPGRLENLRFFIQIICWANHMLQVQSTVLPSIFLRAQLHQLTNRQCSMQAKICVLR